MESAKRNWCAVFGFGHLEGCCFSCFWVRLPAAQLCGTTGWRMLLAARSGKGLGLEPPAAERSRGQNVVRAPVRELFLREPRARFAQVLRVSSRKHLGVRVPYDLNLNNTFGTPLSCSVALFSFFLVAAPLKMVQAPKRVHFFSPGSLTN